MTKSNELAETRNQGVLAYTNLYSDIALYGLSESPLDRNRNSRFGTWYCASRINIRCTELIRSVKSGQEINLCKTKLS
jgi:hypothetical protein